MPLDPVTGTLIAAGAQTLGNVGGQIFGNRANKRESELAYRRQISMWNRTNEYNSPSEQMKRLQAAGLNPNLVYGTGSVGNISSPGPKYEPPQIRPIVPDLGGVALQALQMQQAKANIEQVQAQTQYTKMRTQTEGFNQGLTTIKTKTGEQQLDQMKQLAPYNYEITKSKNWQEQTKAELLLQQVKNMSAQEQSTLLANEYRENQISQQQIDKELKQADLLMKNNANMLKAMGIGENDNILARILVRILNQMGVSIEDVAPKQK